MRRVHVEPDVEPLVRLRIDARGEREVTITAASRSFAPPAGSSPMQTEPAPTV
jgi:hypothetical protein